jgi:hypothetical protein
MSSWGTWLVYVWPALLLTIVGLFLGRVSRDPNTSAVTQFWSTSASGSWRSLRAYCGFRSSRRSSSDPHCQQHIAIPQRH